jgi:phospholipid/cholesterol/gamma-HCH transport system ATP-binding protein
MTTLDDEALPPDDSSQLEKALNEPDNPAPPEVEERAIPAVEFRNVQFSYEDQKVLDGISFTVSKGEIKIILSSSGGGKSTILKLVLGLLKPDAGQIFVDGEEITNMDEEQLQEVREKIGMVFQENALFDSLSVYDNVAFRLHEENVPEEEIEQEVRPLLDFVDLEDDMDKLPGELSGGMQKRVSIARALVGDPKIVLFDEPTVALDPPTATKICELIIELRDVKKVSSILVTHEMDTVKYLTTAYAEVDDKGEVRFQEEESDKLCLCNTTILMMRDGRVIFSGTNEELRQTKDPYIQNFLSGTEMDTTKTD